jgi:hypothetical protein
MNFIASSIFIHTAYCKRFQVTYFKLGQRAAYRDVRHSLRN